MDLEYCPYCMSPVKPGEPCGTCMLTSGSYTPAARHLPPGTVLQGRYLLGRVLGEGGFGITYIGRDLVLGLKVAIKEYFPADKATRDASISMEVSSYMGNSSSLYLRGKANFLREAQTIARLDRQPNIVSVKDFFEANNTAYIIMEYIDGTTFKELVDQRGGKLPAWELLHLIEPMFSALSTMHDLGLIHRDISPENLMLEQGTVRLLDFGCARESANGDATMTIMLRHGYAPLEQYQSSSEGQGAWTDIYALSATIYYCITGKKPPQAMDRLLEDGLVPPRNLGVDLSERQEKALLKGLSIYPRTRFRSAEEFHAALYLGSPPVPEPPAPEPPAPEPPAPGPKPNREPVPEPDREPVPEPEPETEPVTDKLPAWLKEHKKAVVIGAAALLAVVVIVAAIAAGLGQPDPASSDPVSTGPGVTDLPDSSADVFNPGYVYNWDLDRFEELMRDDSVTTIVIPKGEGLSIDRPMEITKPVQMGIGAQLHVNAEVTISSRIQMESHSQMHINAAVILPSTLSVAQYANVYNSTYLTITGEGRLELYGYYGADGLLRTVDGGTIAIGDTGWADFSTLWLERSGDLEADSSRFNLDQRRYIVADEDALFEKAAHVGSFEELENAANDRRTDAIVVDGSLTMEYWLTVSKPILISEGAALFTRFGESGIVFGDVAVNRGRVDGDLQFNDGGVYLNYGSSDVRLYTNSTSCILNLGELCFRQGQDRWSAIVNLGRITLETHSSGDHMTIFEGIMMNHGDIDLISGCLEFRAAAYFGNCGTVRVSADAEIRSSGYINTNGGKLILEGNLWNDTVLDLARMDDSLELQGGSIEGGIFLTWEERSRLEETGAIHNCVVLTDRMPADRYAEMESRRDLEAMGDSTALVTLSVGGNIAVDGDLTLTRDLVVNGTLEVTGRLIMDGGVLENHGTLSVGSLELRGGALLRQSGGLLRLNGGTLALSDSGAIIYSEIDLGGGRLELHDTARFFNSNDIRNVGGIRVDSGSYLYNWTNIELQENAGIDVDASEFASSRLDVGGSVAVSSGGRLNFPSSVHLYGGSNVTVTAGGSRFDVAMGMQMDGGTRLVNDGLVSFDGWEASLDLNGDIINQSDGLISLYGNPIYVNGAFRNEGNLNIGWGALYIGGELNNQGTAEAHNADGNEVVIQGNWTGRAVEYR